jgi:sugar phosphate isomerase/epimerase
MMRLSVSELTTYRWTLEEDIAQYQACGFEGIGVWRHKLSDCGEEHGIDLLAASALKVSSLQWIGGFTGSDGCTQREAIDDGIEALRIAAALNADCLIAFTGSRGGHTRHHSRRIVLEALNELAAAAYDLEVTLAIEPMHPGCGYHWTFVHDLNDSLSLIDEVKAGPVKMVFDIYHLAHEHFDRGAIAGLVDRIALVQVGDARKPPRGEQNRCLLGTGAIPLSEILLMLDDAGYGGFYEIELMGEELERHDYLEKLSHAKEFFSELTAVR